MTALSRSLVVTGLLIVAATTVCAADDAEFFEAKIRPLFIQRCQECHSAQTKRQGGLVLDAKTGWEAGGDSGPAVVPGDPERSLLIKAVRWRSDDLQMPPKEAGGRLPDTELANLETWVKSGAFDPRVNLPNQAPKRNWADVVAERRKWWSLQPVRPTPAPPEASSEWSAPVDRFVYQRLRSDDLTPSPLASPGALLRRVTIVLTGLPPTPDEIASFEAAARENRTAAYADLVDRLLASPRYGERFARHWLDVVRFTETHGNEWNYDVPYAWRYRDYMVRALNADVPYDRLVREHIAGDLDPQPRRSADGRALESPIGNAFYRFGEVNHDSCERFPIIGYDIVDNQLDTLTKTFQATTVACARCHDHKLDAVSTRDYHALLAVLRSTRSVQQTLDSPEVNREPLAALKALKQDLRPEMAAVWRAQTNAINVERLQQLADAAKAKPPGIESPLAAWFAACSPDATDVAAKWSKLAEDQARQARERTEFNASHFTMLADFRSGLPDGWSKDGMGLREPSAGGGDFVVAHEGDAAVKGLLSAGVFTFALSDKLNGALRSPTLRRTHAKVSFEALGGRFSLTRLVFNNCQLNYNHQHSLHHDDWSWVTIDFPDHTAELHPYAELLTFWDNPKFPDPLGTLGKDTENQREPFETHAKNPRTWWGVRRIVLHDQAEAPRDELAHLTRLFAGEPPASREVAAARYAEIARDAIEAFAANRATDDDVRWLDWFVKSGLLSNKAAASQRLAELVAQYRDVENHQLSLPTVIPGMADEGAAFVQPVLRRGDYTKPGETVAPGYAESLTPSEFRFNSGGSGRRELAEAIASADNPLTARVIVNRAWQWIFGRGLVGSPDDFGHLGETPTHPELLDYLAARFVAEGWSIKRLARELVLSRTFQADSAPTPEARQRDPRNLLLAHYNSRRMEAEVIRDSILAVSGRLDPQMFGPSVHPYRETADTEKRLYTGPLDGAGRRSLYLKFQLMEPPHFLRAFNLPGGKVTQGRRDASNTPAQSLAMLNDPFVLAMADVWAGRLVEDGRTAVAERGDTMFRAAFARSPTTAELADFVALAGELASVHGVEKAELMSSRPVWKDAAHALFNLQEFIYIP
jgi:hypothetical protein